ncbi:MAG: cytidine deaminase [Acidobacteriota bacterium]|nr:cytidine deaminase [Acidobacteriota bacterium]
MNRPDRLHSITAEQYQELQRRAQAAASHAYAPYSRFYVGAAVLYSTPDASVHIADGCNVENASFRLTTCAEQAAIASAVCQNGPTIHILAVVIVNRDNRPCQPCGACLQTILEFGKPDTVLVFPSEGDEPTVSTLAKILPAAFLLDL